MGRLLKLGCLGIIGLVVVVGIIIAIGASQSKPAQQQVSGQPVAPATAVAKPEPAKVGQTANLGGWEVTLLDFGPYERFAPGKPPPTKSQGRLVVADMRIKNRQNASSNFTTNDFVLKSGDGREFQPTGETAIIERGFMISQSVQPGLVTENRVVFDIDPAAKDLVFRALGVQFSVPNP